MDPSPESYPEPEYNDSNSSDCDNAQPEPHPDWQLAKMEWGAAWGIHVYVFAVAFAVLALAAAYLLTKRKQGQFKRRYFSSLEVLLFILGVTRFFSLVLDPYGSNDPVMLPSPLQRVLFGLALPCLLSAFSLIFLTLMEASKVRFVHRNVMTWKVIAALCASHFILNTLGDLLVAYNIEAQAVLLTCFIYLCLWGLFLFVGFPAVGRKIIYNLVHTSRSVRKKARKEPLLKIARLTYGSAVCGGLLLTVNIYFLLDVYGEAKQDADECHSHPWLWWSFQSVARIVEILMSVLLLYSTYDPQEQSRISCLRLKPCAVRVDGETNVKSCRKDPRIPEKRQAGDKEGSHVVEIKPSNEPSLDSGVCVQMESSEALPMKQRESAWEDQANNCMGTPEPLLKSPKCRQSEQQFSKSGMDSARKHPTRSVSAHAGLQRRVTEMSEVDLFCDNEL